MKPDRTFAVLYVLVLALLILGMLPGAAIGAGRGTGEEQTGSLGRRHIAAEVRGGAGGGATSPAGRLCAEPVHGTEPVQP